MADLLSAQDYYAFGSLSTKKKEKNAKPKRSEASVSPPTSKLLPYRKHKVGVFKLDFVGQIVAGVINTAQMMT
jgi:hypothetical protein